MSTTLTLERASVLQDAAMRRHLVYHFLLKKCLRLEPTHAKQLMAFWNCSMGTLRREGYRSAPNSEIRRAIFNYSVENFVQVEGVPGFYVWMDYSCELDEVPLPYWRVNWPRAGAILRPYRDKQNLIRGIMVYRSASDPDPFLLSSNGMILGTKAERYNPFTHH